MARPLLESRFSSHLLQNNIQFYKVLNGAALSYCGHLTLPFIL